MRKPSNYLKAEYHRQRSSLTVLRDLVNAIAMHGLDPERFQIRLCDYIEEIDMKEQLGKLGLELVMIILLINDIAESLFALYMLKKRTRRNIDHESSINKK